jgi:hypothetical protein
MGDRIVQISYNSKGFPPRCNPPASGAASDYPWCTESGSPQTGTQSGIAEPDVFVTQYRQRTSVAVAGDGHVNVTGQPQNFVYVRLHGTPDPQKSPVTPPVCFHIPVRGGGKVQIVLPVRQTDRLLEQDVQFRLGWNDTEENRCILHEIRELDDLIAILPRLLSAAGSRECDSGAALLLQTRPDALCGHMVYVAHTPAAEVLDWSSYGHLTVLAVSNGGVDAIRFDETNYPTQLAVLVI